MVLFAALSAPVFAENEFALSLAPAFEIPAGKEHLGPGAGAAASVDWAFLPFMGLSAGGGFSSLSTAAGSGFTLYRGGIGPFFRWRPLDRWTFRAGVQAGAYQYRWEDYGNARLFAGGGLRAEFHLSPYVYLYTGGEYFLHAFSDKPLNVFTLSAGVRLNLSEIMGGEARIRGEKIEQRRVFPVSWAWYKDNPAATLRITNNEPNTITDVSLSLFMARYMGQPELFASLPRLAPGETAELPVTALFNEVMLSLTENVTANGQIRMSYRSLGARKETDFPIQMPIYHRNALSWDDDRRAASFVSARDPAARLFARYAASIVDGLPENGIPRNVRYAAALFETLAAYRINYVIDPASSFVEMSGDAAALDSLNYPYQTLYYRGGDCDDLSILYCSMLETLGVDTAFITIPGHIYMAFDTGAEDSLSSDAGKDALGTFIEHEGRLWMPVEVTVPNEGFYQAWRIGVREWRTAGEERRLYPMGESWKVYPPVTVPEAGNWLPVLPEEGEIVRRFTEMVERLGE
ncbi:MAG: autotransporter outer membrane beta-barrel domain-containing protein [Treponema sp.]|nr:autotransporter outer membrane beta-barrel domain-containing protein [Treponema sp.]